MVSVGWMNRHHAGEHRKYQIFSTPQATIYEPVFFIFLNKNFYSVKYPNTFLFRNKYDKSQRDILEIRIGSKIT